MFDKYFLYDIRMKYYIYTSLKKEGRISLRQLYLFKISKLFVDVSAYINVPNKSTIPTSGRVSLVLKTAKSTSEGETVIIIEQYLYNQILA